MPAISDEKRALFKTFASEFERSYLLEPAGQQHQAIYKRERDDVARFWSEISAAKQQGKAITDLVLEKLS